MTLAGPALALALTLGYAAAAAQARTPDLEHGREVALNGGAAGVQPCAACHKLDGTGDASGAFPRLTGQAGFYLYKQLKDYAAGLRESQIMGPVARLLSESEMQDAAAWYASAAGPFKPPPAGDPEAIRRGGVLAAAGAAERNIPACANCHGPAGAGLPPSIPALAGQFARYAEAQLAAWKDGSRRNDPLDVMRGIAARLSDRDRADLAEYFARVSPPQRPPPPAFPGQPETDSLGSAATAPEKPN